MTLNSLDLANYFGDFLQACWDQLGLNQETFARQLGKASGYISQIRKGKKPPPLHDIERWADVLELKGEYRERLFELAWMAHSPEQVGSMIARYRKMLRDAKLARESLERKNSELAAKVEEIVKLYEERERRLKAEYAEKIAACERRITEIETRLSASELRVAEAIRHGYRI